MKNGETLDNIFIYMTLIHSAVNFKEKKNPKTCHCFLPAHTEKKAVSLQFNVLSLTCIVTIERPAKRFVSQNS